MDAKKMSSDMRAEFIHAFVDEFGFGPIAASTNADAANMLRAAEWAWKASREALVITLPEPQQKPELGISSYREGKADGIESGIIQCIKAIERQGFKVEA